MVEDALQTFEMWGNHGAKNISKSLDEVASVSHIKCHWWSKTSPDCFYPGCKNDDVPRVLWGPEENSCIDQHFQAAWRWLGPQCPHSSLVPDSSQIWEDTCWGAITPHDFCSYSFEERSSWRRPTADHDRQRPFSHQNHCGQSLTYLSTHNINALP